MGNKSSFFPTTEFYFLNINYYKGEIILLILINGHRVKNIILCFFVFEFFN